jgi:hypothetical protein
MAESDELDIWENNVPVMQLGSSETEFDLWENDAPVVNLKIQDQASIRRPASMF